MTNWKRFFTVFLLSILLLPALAARSEAASRGMYYRPAVTFVASNAPDDMILRLDIESNGEVIPVFLYREDRFWESYFRLYRQTEPRIRWRGNRHDFSTAVLVAITGGREIRIPLPEETLPQLTMNDYYMLDVSQFSLRYGRPLGRAAGLFFLRLAITLSVSMLILFLFGYRWRKSWIIVLITNLICQGGLSLLIANQINFNPYLIGVQWLAILGVLVVQIIVFCMGLAEGDSDSNVSYTVWSNAATGVLNTLMLIFLPL